MFPNSIADWKVNDMLQCCIYENYTSLGVVAPDEVQSRLDVLLSQYYQAKGDVNMQQYSKLRIGLKDLEVRSNTIAILIDTITTHYDDRLVVIFKKLYPQFQFTPESLIKDIDMVCKGEISNKLKHERLTKQMEVWEKANGGGEKMTQLQKHTNFTNKLFEINSVEGVKYDVSTMSVMELAVAENRYNAHVEHLKSQVKSK